LFPRIAAREEEIEKEINTRWAEGVYRLRLEKQPTDQRQHHHYMRGRCTSLQLARRRGLYEIFAGFSRNWWWKHLMGKELGVQ
jgi:hypothetical protein